MEIQAHRLSMNMTQEDVAEALGVERSTVSMWEIGQSAPRAAMLPALAALLHCSIDDLLCEGEDCHSAQEKSAKQQHECAKEGKPWNPKE